jgi:hypothetical protein
MARDAEQRRKSFIVSPRCRRWLGDPNAIHCEPARLLMHLRRAALTEE